MERLEFCIVHVKYEYDIKDKIAASVQREERTQAFVSKRLYIIVLMVFRHRSKCTEFILTIHLL